MGGVSTGGMYVIDNMLSFKGNVSRERNGGFSSTRFKINIDLS